MYVRYHRKHSLDNLSSKLLTASDFDQRRIGLLWSNGSQRTQETKQTHLQFLKGMFIHRPKSPNTFNCEKERDQLEVKSDLVRFELNIQKLDCKS